MIVEAFKYAAARLRGQSDKHGHLAEAIAMEARHQRQRHAWQTHLDNSRALCLAATEACTAERRRTALVVGSGLLLDVPLEELCHRFDTVVLADLAFLPKVSARAKALGNVSLLRLDLTACLDKLPELARLLTEGKDMAEVQNERLGPPPALAAASHNHPKLLTIDFVYSANVLSQLPLFVVPGLLRHAPHLPQTLLDIFAKALIDSHLVWLQTLPCPACLVTDRTEHATAFDKEATVITDLLYGATLPSGPGAQSWTWDFACGGEAVAGMDVRRTVLGILDMHTARYSEENSR